MNNGLGYKLANVPTITGLSTVTADEVVSESINTESLFINGVDVSSVITQVPINTANIAILQQLTTGISYSDSGGIDLTTVDNNLTVTSGKKLKSDTVASDNDDVVNKLFVDNALVNITGITYSNTGGIDLTTIDNNVTITSGKKLKCSTTATTNDDVANKLFVDTAIANLVDSAPATLDTLNELANALGDDPNFATTVTTLIAGKVSLTGNETISGEKTFNNLTKFQLANILVDNAGGTITVGNGGSTLTANIVLSKLTTATSTNFNVGNNTLIGPRVGNSMVAASSNNTYVGDNSGRVASGSNNTFLGSNAGSTVSSGANNICIGRDSAVPTITASNQIAIGTSAETMYIQGGHNWRFFAPSTGITGSITLSFPFYQIYPIVVNTPIIITFPTATTAMLGAHFYFKKLIFNSTITFASTGSPAIVPYNGLTATSSVTMSTTQFQTEFYCNGAVYYQVNTDLPNTVFTDTTQTISGAKTFSSATTFGDNITLNNVNQNNRQINNTVYNLYDGGAVAGGVYRAKLYSTASTITFDLDTPTAFGIYTAGANNIFNVSVSNCTIKTTNNPTITGFTDPIASDSSNKIASTRWVQSAITAGASTTISTTATTTQPYYLVGSINSTTSSDTTLYKNSRVYVNPATGGIFCDEQNIFNSNAEAFTYSFSSLSQFDFANTSLSSPNTTVFYNNNSVGSLVPVLTLNGNAGASTFDGLSSASTTVAVTDNNTSTTMYPVFTTTGAGQKSLLFDTSTTPLRYKPSSGEIAAYQYSVGGILEPVPGNNAGLLSQNTGSSATVIQNQATSGKIQLITTDALNNLVTSIETSTSATTIRSATSIIAGSVGSASSLAVKDSGTRSFQFIPNASGGALNALTVLNDSLLYGTAGSIGTGALTLSIWSNTTTGVRITPTTASIGAGGTGSTPSSYASFQASGVTIGGATNMMVGTGASSTRAFQVDESGGVGISMLPNSTVGSYNPIIAVNDSVIFGDNTAIDTSDLVLTTWSATTCGVRINATTALIGAGGGGPTPTAYVSCNGTTVTIKGELQVTDRNLLVDAGVNALTIGNGSSTGTSNILITRTSLAQTRNFTFGGNVLIGNVSGNSLVVASTNNTFLGTSSGTSASGSTNICIGYNSQVPTAGNNNQIAIGTSLETMYIRGGFNWRIGTQITNSTNGNLSVAVLAQFYTVAMTLASQTILLPTPTTAAYLGARVTFKRKTNTTVFTITAGAGTPFIPINSIVAAASISVAATVFQVDLVCDGTNWCSFGQT